MFEVIVCLHVAPYAGGVPAFGTPFEGGVSNARPLRARVSIGPCSAHDDRHPTHSFTFTACKNVTSGFGIG